MHRQRFDLGGLVAHVVSTDRSDGDFSLQEDRPTLTERRHRVVDRPWLALRQVHGAVVADGDLAIPVEPVVADAAVTTSCDVAISVLTADCAPVVLVGSTGVAVVHAGWRGAAAGVIEAAADELLRRGSAPVATVLGPCILPAAYEFGASDLEPIASAFGSEVVARTSDGRPALDVPRLVQIACERSSWPAPPRPACTSDPRWFSHRTRRDGGRQATVAWLETE